MIRKLALRGIALAVALSAYSCGIVPAAGPGQTERVAAGDVIEGSVINLPGVMTVRVNGAACDGEFAIESGLRTYVVLTATDAGCLVEETGSEPL